MFLACSSILYVFLFYSNKELGYDGHGDAMTKIMKTILGLLLSLI